MDHDHKKRGVFLSRSICIISGKGGTGKTTSAISLAHVIGKHKKILLVDANLTTPNINIHLGAPILRNTLMNVLRDEVSLKEAVYTHESGLRILPAISSKHDLKRLKYDKIKETLHNLKNQADFIILDAAAGLGREAISAIEASDEVLIITNPELSAVLDAQKTIQVAQELGKTILGAVINKYIGDRYDLKVNNVERLLDLPVIGVIPYDNSVREALKMKQPVTHTHPKSKASKEYERVAGLILGKKYMQSINKKQSMKDYVLKGLGMG